MPRTRRWALPISWVRCGDDVFRSLWPGAALGAGLTGQADYKARSSTRAHAVYYVLTNIQAGWNLSGHEAGLTPEHSDRRPPELTPSSRPMDASGDLMLALGLVIDRLGLQIPTVMTIGHLARSGRTNAVDALPERERCRLAILALAIQREDIEQSGAARGRRLRRLAATTCRPIPIVLHPVQPPRDSSCGAAGEDAARTSRWRPAASPAPVTLGTPPTECPPR